MNRVSISAGEMSVFVDMDDNCKVHAVSGPHLPEEILKTLHMLASATIEFMRQTDTELGRMFVDEGPPRCVVVLEPEELIALMWAVETVKGKHDPVVMAHSRAAYGVLVEKYQEWLRLTA